MARAIFSLLEKTHPWFTKFEFEKFFSLFYIISTQRSYIYKKRDTNRCFVKLRAIQFCFFMHPVYLDFLRLYFSECRWRGCLERCVHSNWRSESHNGQCFVFHSHIFFFNSFPKIALIYNTFLLD
jgi:hypothetical protein